MLSSLAPGQLRSVASASAIQHLESDRKLWVARQLARDEEGLEAARDLFKQLLTNPSGPSSQQDIVRHELSIALMGLGQVEEAQRLIGESPTLETSVSEAFNHAMATWALDGSPSRPLLERVLALDKDKGTANYAECLAVTLGVLGDREGAQQRLNQARQRMASRPEPQVSCWRYRMVPPNEFLKDLEEIRNFIDTPSVRPLFFTSVPTHS